MAGNPTGAHSARASSVRAKAEAEAEATRATYIAAMEAKCGWSTRFPLTGDRVCADLRTVPNGRLVHLARAAERWKVHPTIARILIYDVMQDYTAMFETWDPDDLNDGMFPEDVSRWWG